MFKKLKFILGILCVIALCTGLAACKKTDELDKYDVLVYYDANGGEFLGKDNVTIVDGFDYDNFEAEADGTYTFKLLEPTSPKRPESPQLTKSQSFFAGWYKTRTAQYDEDGNILDAEGRPLVEVKGENEVKGTYYVKGTENAEKADDRIQSEPYYSYDDKWDFENDVLTCDPEDGKIELRLYAGWVSYYFFDYYVEEDGEWVRYGQTYFNYGVLGNEQYSDRDTIWTPEWKDGAMNHEHSYKDNSKYTFPVVEDCTFKAAYEDEACTQKIEGSVKHGGSLDEEHAKAINPVKNIYVVVEKGVRFRIEKAQQLADNPNPSATYEILDDLDFADVKWPAVFSTAVFSGKLIADESVGAVKISNVSVALSGTYSYGGLFGMIAPNAEIKNISFENVDVKVASTGTRNDCSIGLFAGEISEKAAVENVTISGSMGLCNIQNNPNCTINAFVGGDNRAGVTLSGGVRLYAYGEEADKIYLYHIDIESVSVDADGNITVTSKNSRLEQETIDITTYNMEAVK